MASTIDGADEKKLELFVTLDFDEEGWDVWFPHPLGGRSVVDSFPTKEEAEAFAEEQRRSATEL